MNTLPDKLSELIMIAINDLKACEKDPDYVIDMSEWHHPVGDKCHVCLAGAVIAKTCDASRFQRHKPENDELGNKLKALNSIRQGLILQAVWCMYSEGPPASMTRTLWMVPDYGRPGFYEKLIEIADYLKGFGL